MYLQYLCENALPSRRIRLDLLDDLLEEPLAQYETRVGSVDSPLPRRIIIGLSNPFRSLAVDPIGVLPEPSEPLLRRLRIIQLIRFRCPLEQTTDKGLQRACLLPILIPHHLPSETRQLSKRPVEIQSLTFHHVQEGMKDFRLVTVYPESEREAFA